MFNFPTQQVLASVVFLVLFWFNFSNSICCKLQNVCLLACVCPWYYHVASLRLDTGLSDSLEQPSGLLAYILLLLLFFFLIPCLCFRTLTCSAKWFLIIGGWEANEHEVSSHDCHQMFSPIWTLYLVLPAYIFAYQRLECDKGVNFHSHPTPTPTVEISSCPSPRLPE